MSGLHGLADHAQNSGVVGVIEGVQLGVLPVNGQGVLGQIVGAQGEELHLLSQLLGHHHGGGGLDHDADLHLAHGHAPLPQLPAALLQHVLGVPDLPHGDNHGEHDGHGAEGTGPEDGPQLGLEDVPPGQADADGPVAQGRVLLLVQAEVVRLLVRADVQGADDDFFAGHGLRHPLVDSDVNCSSSVGKSWLFK